MGAAPLLPQPPPGKDCYVGALKDLGPEVALDGYDEMTLARAIARDVHGFLPVGSIVRFKYRTYDDAFNNAEVRAQILSIRLASNFNYALHWMLALPPHRGVYVLSVAYNPGGVYDNGAGHRFRKEEQAEATLVRFADSQDPAFKRSAIEEHTRQPLAFMDMGRYAAVSHGPGSYFQGIRRPAEPAALVGAANAFVAEHEALRRFRQYEHGLRGDFTCNHHPAARAEMAFDERNRLGSGNDPNIAHDDAYD